MLNALKAFASACSISSGRYSVAFKGPLQVDESQDSGATVFRF